MNRRLCLGKLKERQALGRPCGKWKYNLNLYFKEIRYDCQELN